MDEQAYNKLTAEEEHVIRFYSVILGRPPSDDELKLAHAFLAMNSLEQFAQVLLMSNELMFVE